MIEVTVENVEKVLRDLVKYSAAKEKEVDKVVKKFAKEVVVRAKANAPVGPTSNLRNSIRPKYFRRQGPSATVFPRGSKGHHRHLVEYGTGPRTIKNWYGQKGVRKNIRPMPKKPFMKPAQDSVVGQYLAEMQKVVDKVDTV